MKIFAFIFLMICTITVYSQDSPTPTLKDSTKSYTEIALDSANEYLRRMEMERWEKNNLSGLEYLMRIQKEQQEKRNKQAMIRIGIGILFLVVLGVGIARKKRNLNG